ncbi:hypothetical protein VaNZ11_011994 [Volvox africanus]|uniref:Uncharacterized protein n=1 Tax=Volvox africanus TaxID=51714 RepID=A0ABQ5SCY5_9CHLO|nr:hypothetical protein VaNZ11_011994 [Volvox africanus]
MPAELMELTPDASPPPSREVSPFEHARRTQQPELALGPSEDIGELGEPEGEQALHEEQQQQQRKGDQGPSIEDAEAAVSSTAIAQEAGGAGEPTGGGDGEEVADRVPELATDLAANATAAGADETAEASESPRGATGVGSEPSAELVDPGGGSRSGGAPAAPTVPVVVASATALGAVIGGHSSRGLAELSRGEMIPVGSRGIQGVRGISKSFTTGRISPSRQSRNVGNTSAVRDAVRTSSAHSSRPASSAIAASSLPPSPDPYGSDGPPGTGTISMWATGSIVSGSGYHPPGSPPLSLEDVEVRGAAMKLLSNSSITREGKEGPAAAGRPSGLAATAVAPPLPSSPPPVSEAMAPPSASPAQPGVPPAATVQTPPLQLEAEQDSGQQPGSISSVPSMAMGSTVVAVGRNRPLLMPFFERQAAALAAAAAAGDPTAAGLPPQAAAAMALALAPAVGRRSGPHGSIRHGSAYQQQPLLPVSTSQASAPRDSSTSVRRLGAAKDIHGTGASPMDTPSSRTPAATGEGDLEDLPPAPPLYAVPSRDWDKPHQARSSTHAVAASSGCGGNYAAGGGAAAVKAAAAVGGAKAGVGGISIDLQLQQQLMLGEAIQIRSIHKTGVAPGLDPLSVSASGMGGVGVPGRRGRRLPAHPTAGSATAATMAAYFAGVEASIAEGDKAADKMLLPSGLARRLKAARIMAQGPRRFQRRQEPPPPPSPTGIKLDGFMLLEAADEEMPEAVQFATLESRSISAVESADLSYFIALRSLDVSDNKLPDLVCLATLQALVRLRAASCRLTTLGRWPGGLTGTEGSTCGSPAKSTSGIIKRGRTRKFDAGGGAGSNGATEAGEVHDSWTAGAEGNGQADTATSALRSEPSWASANSDAAGSGGSGGAHASSAAADRTTTTTEPSLVASLLARVNGRPFQYLEVLDLSFNQLQAHMVLLPSSPLALLPRLAELDLSSNHLKHLPSPAEITAAAARVAAAMAAGVPAAAAVGGVAFRALRRLRLAGNGLKGSAMLSLAALGLPSLHHLDLSHNAISEVPRVKLPSLSQEDSTISVASTSHVAVSASNGLGPNSNGNIGLGNGNAASQHVMPKSASQRLLQQSSQHRLSPQISAQQLMQSAQPQQVSLSLQEREQQDRERFGNVLTRLAVLDLTFNKVVSEGGISALTHLPALQRLLLAGNPLAITAQRPNSQRASGGSTIASKLDFGEPEAGPMRPTVAASLTARFARIPEAAPKQQANTLATAAATVITAAAAPERVTEAYDRLDATIEQWRLNTVMEEDEEEDEEEAVEVGDDRTFLTGVGIQERRRKNSTATTINSGASADADPMLDTVAEAPAEGQDDAAATATETGVAAAEERPLWESITDPTERLAVALGLDPLSLPMHTGALTVDSAGAIAALRFALAHPLVEANDGLAPHPGYLAATTATQLKRKARRPVPTQRLVPMATSNANTASTMAAQPAIVAAAGAGPKAAKIQTVEAMLEGMKGKLAALEASLTAQLAAAPTAPSAEAVRRAEDARYGGFGRRGDDTDSEDGDDDGGSTGSGLPEDVIDQIERESDSEDDEDERAIEEEMGPIDPKQGIVLMAEQLGAESSAADVASNAVNGNGNGNGSDPAASPGRGVLGSSTPSRVIVTGTSPRTAGGSPRRVNTIASVGGTSNASPRKGVSIGGTVSVTPAMSTTPLGLPGGAASALGYAS